MEYLYLEPLESPYGIVAAIFFVIFLVSFLNFTVRYVTGLSDEAVITLRRTETASWISLVALAIAIFCFQEVDGEKHFASPFMELIVFAGGLHLGYTRKFKVFGEFKYAVEKNREHIERERSNGVTQDVDFAVKLAPTPQAYTDGFLKAVRSISLLTLGFSLIAGIAYVLYQYEWISEEWLAGLIIVAFASLYVSAPHMLSYIFRKK